ncbi:hypothetical protein BLOT_013591 [Blomia tropicalis]|nr:hypothetical protein BLOT_013591 [Blomia tropicalis]
MEDFHVFTCVPLTPKLLSLLSRTLIDVDSKSNGRNVIVSKRHPRIMANQKAFCCCRSRPHRVVLLSPFYPIPMHNIV